MQRVELPDGQYATLRDKVNVGGRQILDRTAAPAFYALRRIRKLREDELSEETETEVTPSERARFTEAEWEALQRFQKASIVAFVKHWTLDDFPPRSIEDVEELDPDVYEPLAKATAPLAKTALARPKVSPDNAFDADGKPDPDSFTGPSTGSSSGERASSSRSHPETSTVS